MGSSFFFSQPHVRFILYHTIKHGILYTKATEQEENEVPRKIHNTVHTDPPSILGFLPILIQCALTAGLAILLKNTNLLPNKWRATLCITASVLGLLSIAWQYFTFYKHKSNQIGHTLSILVCVVYIALISGLWYTNHTIKQITTDTDPDTITNTKQVTKKVDTSTAKKPDRKSVTQAPFLVLLSGKDNWDNPDQEPGRDTDEASRTDVNILAAIDPKNHKVLLVSTPRDTFVQIPGVTDQNEIPMYDKLTHAGTYGIDAVKDAHQWLYGQTPDYYMQVNFSSFVEIIDAIDGIDIEIDTPFTMSNGFSFQEGLSHLDGGQALAFVRERKSFEDGDFQRGRNQQKLIKAVIEKMITPKNLLKLPKLIKSVSKNIDTDVPNNLLEDLIRSQLEENASWNIEAMQLSCTDSMSSECFSAYGQSLYVAQLDETSRDEIKTALDVLLNQ